VFHFTPASGRAVVSSRIRLADSQIVVAVAEMSDGSRYIARAPTKVAIGGCSSGAVPALAVGELGDPRVKLPVSVRPGEVFEIKTLLAHPMQTGRQTDLAGAPLPRLVVDRFACTASGSILFSAEFGTGVAANPYLAFRARLERSAELHFVWTEESGRAFETTQVVAVGS
jgi:hypothetical protein